MKTQELIKFIKVALNMYNLEDGEVELIVISNGKEIKCPLENTQIRFDTKDGTVSNFTFQLRGYEAKK